MLMNSKSNSAHGQEAMLVYGPNAFKVVKPGHYVRCAVSGEPIALEELRYWSADRQEAYANPQAATRRLLDQE